MRLSILAFSSGIALLQIQDSLPALVILGGAGVLAVSGIVLCARCKGWLVRALSLFCCALFGFFWAGGIAQQRLSDALPEAWETREIQLTGVIASLPLRFEGGERFAFDVESVQTKGAVVPGRIMLSWYRSRDVIADTEATDGIDGAGVVRPGERWRLTVRLKRPHGNANPHGFDYEAWLLERNIRATGTIRKRSEAKRLNAFVLRPGYMVERLRDHIRDRFISALPDAPLLGVLVALAIGDQRAIPSSQWQVFNRTGITHLVSISGLHVTMVAAFFALLINGLWRRSERLMLCLPAQKAAVVAGWLAAFGYALLAGFEVPAQRTFYMLTVVALALWSGRNFGAGRTLLLALLLVLLLDPWAILVTGFWLSFGAVALLFFVGVSRVGEGHGASGWRTTLAQWGMSQWAVTLGSLPLLLLFFQQFSLVSPLANAIAIPVVSFVITPLALAFAVLPWPPLLHLDHWLMFQLMLLIEWLAQWPVWQQPAPPLWASLVALTGVAWMLLPRGFPARWLGLYLLMPALFWPAPRPVPGGAWIDVLDVGQGLAVLVRTAEHTLLYDTGPFYSATSNAGQRVVVPYLRASGVKNIDVLVVSHRDKDHAGGVTAIQEYLPIERILTSMPELDGELCAVGQNWEWEGVRFEMLHPVSADYLQKSKSTNQMSCVLRVSNGGQSVLLTADIEATNEKEIIKRSSPALHSDVLLVPHHGGRGSSSPEFIAAVAPADVVFSAGYRNPFNHPRPEVLELYSASRQWRTDRDGAVRIEITATTQVSAWRQVHRRYWSTP